MYFNATRASGFLLLKLSVVMAKPYIESRLLVAQCPCRPTTFFFLFARRIFFETPKCSTNLVYDRGGWKGVFYCCCIMSNKRVLLRLGAVSVPKTRYTVVMPKRHYASRPKKLEASMGGIFEPFLTDKMYGYSISRNHII